MVDEEKEEGGEDEDVDVGRSGSTKPMSFEKCFSSHRKREVEEGMV